LPLRNLTHAIRYTRIILVLLVQLGIAQQTDTVDFTKIGATLEFGKEVGSVRGKVFTEFELLQAADSVYLDAVRMKITDTELRSLKVTAEEKKIWIHGPFQKGEKYSTIFYYEAIPSQTLYFTGNQIWTQGQGKYTSHWLPSIDDMNDKIEFDLQILATSDQKVIANGQLDEIVLVEDLNAWRFDMDKPMSSYLAAIAIGNFEVHNLQSTSGVPIELYYELKDSSKLEPTYRFTKEIFDFLETEIGLPYPWQNYKQVPVRDFLYAGMENTTATFFSEAFVVDSIGFNDRNYVNVNAHELAHQWFGNLVTETESTHHWLHEGFATYYAMLAEKELFGDEYYYWKLFQSAEQLKSLSEEGKGQSLLDPKASSLTFYEKGAWALHILKELVGKEVFDKAVRNYLVANSFQNVKTEDFLTEVKRISGQDLVQFEADWLHQSAFKTEQAYQSLIKSPFIERYFEVSSLAGTPLSVKKLQLRKALLFPNDYIGQEAIYQLNGEPIDETVSYYRLGLESNNLYIRQAIALTLEGIPQELLSDYETLLDDTSYVTQEAALYNLWTHFPERRSYYLDKMEGVDGFQSKNIRQLWLVLALIDPNYRIAQKDAFVSELKTYAAPSYSFELREVALGYLYELQIWDAESLHYLLNAAVHHTWRFRNYARKIMDDLLNNSSYRDQFLNAMDSYTEKEQLYLQSKLKTD
jgi:aminopeptidase N